MAKKMTKKDIEKEIKENKGLGIAVKWTKIYQYLKIPSAFFTNPLIYFVTNKKGLSLTGVLVTGAVGAIVIGGTLKTMSVTLQSAQVARSSLTESDLKFVVSKTLNTPKPCEDNLKPKAENVPPTPGPTTPIGLYGQHREHARGEVVRLKTAGDDLIKGKNFKGDLNIVAMKLSGESTAGPDNDPKQSTEGVTRDFTVFYKKVGMGSHSTRGGEDCSATTLKGCYFTQCQVKLKFQNQANPTVTSCSVMDCASYGSLGGGGGGPPPCYQADDDQTTQKTLVGCGNTKDITATGTTAIGYNAGASLTTGTANTFLGVGAGWGTSSGRQNVFIGSGAGSNAGGSDNTFIGKSAGYDISVDSGTGNKNIAIGSDAHVEKTGSNQINIGNIIKAKPGATNKPGILQVCDPTGEHCKEVGKQQDCGPGKVVRGIKSDGTLDCRPGCHGGSILFETLELESPVGTPRRVTYQVGDPVPDYTGETLLGKTRSCKCTGGLKWDHLTKECKPCIGFFKWVLVDGSRTCMSCTGYGAIWESLNGEWQCKCTPPKKKKEKPLVGLA